MKKDKAKQVLQVELSSMRSAKEKIVQQAGRQRRTSLVDDQKIICKVKKKKKTKEKHCDCTESQECSPGCKHTCFLHDHNLRGFTTRCKPLKHQTPTAEPDSSWTLVSDEVSSVISSTGRMESAH